MLNEKRVKHMVRLASYESKYGTEDIKVSTYFKNVKLNLSLHPGNSGLSLSEYFISLFKNPLK